ncbi:DNA polymerase subunit beta [Desulfomarina profundi]|uniref:DNA polymerase subunit beta n=1 Tax=Desulfomarina profundi TaxID=2772557 RepID=A0A8D5FJI4_9BACT|nr:nucleotidyltransferase domain-containing protein [Desulfomarina profundi]BCL60038.1 DNA polymerase subunit beta [Desulfomarina profundi]
MNRDEVLKILRKYKKLNKEKYGLVALGIFGSFARNEQTVSSDIDIVLQTETPNLFNIVHIKDDLQKELHLSVDIVRLRKKMNPSLQRRIEKEALYV